MNPHVLVVDDRAENRLSVTSALGALNVACVTASSGEEALSRVLDYDFALILLDVQMPGMDGFETAELLRGTRRTRHIPIIFLTAISKEQRYVFRGYESGAVDYLFKPVDTDVLRSKVRVFAELWQQRQVISQQAAELREKNEALQRANQELDAFCRTVAHDLKSPIRAMRFFAGRLEATPLDQDGRHQLERIQVATDRMGHLVDDLLTLARATTGELIREELDLAQVARSVMDTLLASDPDRQVEAVIPAALPVNADPRLLRVVLENLLGNAWKYTRDRTPAVIEVGAEEQRAGAPAFFIRDNGAGFDMKFANKLFEPFGRLHSSRDFPGSGVGLSTVERICRRHGGWIQGDGVPDAGAVFRFSFGLPVEGEPEEAGV